MNTKQLLQLCGAVCLMASCKKSPVDRTVLQDGSLALSNEWRLGQDTFFANPYIYSMQDTAFTAYSDMPASAELDYIQFLFSDHPDSFGRYKVVGTFSGSGEEVIAITFSAHSTKAGQQLKAYQTKGTGADKYAQVWNKKGGRTGIILPEVMAKSLTGTDSLRLDANVGGQW